MPAFMIPLIACTTTVKANFLVAGHASQKVVQVWVWDIGVCYPMVVSNDTMTLVRADSLTGYTGLT